ncbi:MAG TPA: YeeE/YedE thiosulfate transporter family protein [Bacteroidota bacterium]|nr:YeeE/YedE thiosulfate transporter family protein [Bacteroidota bacterium]
MGPLVPDIIGPNLNFIVALFIGVAFGWILEQAGFSTSKKLVGLFYGYDFTVLRVFFTAGIVAMFGVIAMQHFGLLDLNLVYINPTFIWSALVGGLVMGLGFVVGGFCPGTSVCAAAIGKIDAMLFVAGSFLGVLAFAEGYPLLEGLYKSGNWGNPQIFETTGIAKSVFVFLLTTVALIAFWAVSLVEARVNKEQVNIVRLSRVTVAVASVGALIAVSGFVLPSQKEHLLHSPHHAGAAGGAAVPTMSVDEFAFRLLDKDARIQIVDFRSPESVKKQPLPHAVAFTVDNLFEKEPARLLNRKKVVNVFVSDDAANDRLLAKVAQDLGHANVRVIEGGLENFQRSILNFDTTRVPASRAEADTYRFRSRARRDLPAVIAAAQGSGPVKKTTKRVVGGC